MEMKKVLGLLTALLLASPVMADVAIATNAKGDAAWIIKDEKVYVCAGTGTKLACMTLDLKNAHAAPMVNLFDGANTLSTDD